MCSIWELVMIDVEAIERRMAELHGAVFLGVRLVAGEGGEEAGIRFKDARTGFELEFVVFRETWESSIKILSVSYVLDELAEEYSLRSGHEVSDGG